MHRAGRPGGSRRSARPTPLAPGAGPGCTGRSVVDVARDLGISAESIYIWQRQDRIGKGLELVLISAEGSAKGMPFTAIRRDESLPRRWHG